MRFFGLGKKREEKPAAPAASTPPAEPAAAAAPAAKPPAGPAVGWRVLFVGGTPEWFQPIEREIALLQPNWLCQHAPTVPEANARQSVAAFDGMILDGALAGGSELINKAKAQGRRTLFIVRTDAQDREALALWDRLGASLAPVEADAAALVGSLKRADRVRNWMADPAIRKLLPMLRKLPAEPRLYAQVTQELQTVDSSVLVVANLIAQDPVMSAKILQVANSAFFGLSYEVNDSTEAVIVLGTERVRSLILLAGVFSQYTTINSPGYTPDQIWRHSVQVGAYARAIAMGETRNGRTAESAFTAGLLHDIGKLVLAGNLPEMCASVRQIQESQQRPQREAELKVFGATHAELGACLLASWGLPLPILEAVAYHHRPEQADENGFSLLSAVHVANVFAQETGQGSGGDSEVEPINLQSLERSGLVDCQKRWREFCGLPAKG